MERAVRESEERLRVAFHLIPDAINIGRLADGVNVAVNEGFCRLTGYSQEECVGRSSAALELWQDPPARNAFFERLGRDGSVHGEVASFHARDGGQLTAHLSSQTFQVAGEAYFLTVTRDITEQRRSERAQYRIADAAGARGTLQAMLKRVHEIVAELMPAPNLYFALYDAPTQMLDFPYYADEHGDVPVGPEPAGRGLTAYVLRTGQPLLLSCRADFEALEGTGEVVPIGAPALSWVGVPLFTQERTVGVVAAQIYSGTTRYGQRDKELLQFVSHQVARAIERKQADDALRASEERFRALIENTSDGIGLLDPEGGILYSSPAMAQILGHVPGTLPGNLSDYLHPQDSARMAETWRNVTSGAGPATLAETRARRRDGSTAIIEGVFNNLLADPAVRGVVLNLRDLTERKQMEARLMMADRMVSVGTLAAGVAHEINNPLAYVMANLGYLAETLQPALSPESGPGPRNLPTGAAARDLLEALREAQGGTERVRDIVRDLKTFSRAEEASDGPVDLHRVLDAAANIAWNEVRHRARLTRDYAREIPFVHGNESRLGQVFLNLIINAAQAIGEGAADGNEIRISTRLEGGRATVHLRDSGHGISSEHRPRLFDPFFTTKPIGVGTGLGLFVCQNIVAALGGEITVDSEPGQGTTFHVALPVAGEPVALPRRPPPSLSGRPARVLVVDDEEAIGAALRRQLFAHHVVTETLAVSALARLRAGERFDLLLCDVMMPQMTGIQLHAVLARELPELAGQLVFMTGGAFTPGARDFLDRVPNVRLEKPIDIDKLRALVDEALRRARQ
jgi:PAS domain S-box-containing protein